MVIEMLEMFVAGDKKRLGFPLLFAWKAVY